MIFVPVPWLFLAAVGVVAVGGIAVGWTVRKARKRDGEWIKKQEVERMQERGEL